MFFEILSITSKFCHQGCYTHSHTIAYSRFTIGRYLLQILVLSVQQIFECTPDFTLHSEIVAKCFEPTFYLFFFIVFFFKSYTEESQNETKLFYQFRCALTSDSNGNKIRSVPFEMQASENEVEFINLIFVRIQSNKISK